MAAARRSWRSIRRDYAHAFPHQVALRHAGGWRTDYTNAALRHLDRQSWRWWSEGGVGIWGFACVRSAVAFEAWATSSGIDWNVPPEQQTDRPLPLRPIELELAPRWDHLAPGRKPD